MKQAYHTRSWYFTRGNLRIFFSREKQIYILLINACLKWIFFFCRYRRIHLCDDVYIYISQSSSGSSRYYFFTLKNKTFQLFFSFFYIRFILRKKRAKTNLYIRTPTDVRRLKIQAKSAKKWENTYGQNKYVSQDKKTREDRVSIITYA